MLFRITGLDPAPFCHLYGLSDLHLADQGVQRVVANAKPGFPDRVELRDAEPGESLLLLNYTHQPANNAYRSSHAIFVREGAERAYDGIDDIPAPLRTRMISLRAFDAGDVMIGADLVPGAALESVIARFLSDPNVRYLQAHYATRGCYAARITRA